MIKKILFWFLVLSFSSVWGGNNYGIFGTGTTSRDSVRVYIATLDTLGYAIDADTVQIKRFYNAALIDSFTLTGAGTRTGFYIQNLAAEAGGGTDSLGEWGLLLRWRVQGKVFTKEGFYTVVPGLPYGTSDPVSLSGTQTFNNTGTWTGSLTGSVGSVTDLADSAIDAASIKGNSITEPKIAAGAINVSEAPNLDAAITTRMATYTQPSGFLAATFPSGTIANTTNITAGTITTVTTVTDLADSAIDAASIKGN